MSLRMTLQEKIGVLVVVAFLVVIAVSVVGTVVATRLSSSTTALSENNLAAMMSLGQTRSALTEANASVFKSVNEIRAGQTEVAVKEKMKNISESLKAVVLKAKETEAVLQRTGLQAKDGAGSLAAAVDAYQKKMVESLDVIVMDISVGSMMLMTTEEDYGKALKLFEASAKEVENSVISRSAEAVDMAKNARVVIALAGGMGLLLFACIAIFTVYAIRRASQKCLDFVKIVSQGDLRTRVEMENKRDEFTRIVVALEKMQEELLQKSLAASRISNGDLSVKFVLVSESDDLGKALIGMRAGLVNIVTSMMDAFHKVNDEMLNLASTSESLRKASQDQAASLEQISSSLQEVSQRVKSSVSATEKAEQEALRASQNAGEGKGKIGHLELSIAQIDEQSKRVSKVMKAIDDIAFQTNLLALNASVEAARAGKHGRGFSVVADEVRALAARSATAARESTELIEGSLQAVASGLSITRDTSTSYDRVFANIESVTDEMKSIAGMSRDQSVELGEVSSALNHLGGITQQTAAFADGVAESASQVAYHSSEVEKILTKFQLS
jgi:methyl-accepting chemotaxis protein